MLSRPWGLVTVFRVLIRLPEQPVSLPSGCGCDAVHAGFRRRRAGVAWGRLAQAVLPLKGGAQAYRRGRSRQAVRTGLRHAAAAGMTTALVPESEAEGVIVTVTRRHSERPIRPEIFGLLGRPGTTVLSVLAGDGGLLGGAVVQACGHISRLELLIVVHDRPDEDMSAARYLLHTAVVDAAIAAGAPLLGVGSALNIEPGLAHWQRILGYRPMNLQLRSPASSAAAPPSGDAQLVGVSPG